MLWLSLNFYQLPLDVFLLKSSDSTLHEYEFAVVENSLLVYCNQAAVDQGLEDGMKVSTAYALSSELKIKQRAYELEKNMLIQLATLAYEFSSQVCLYNEQTILLEVKASCKLFTDLSSLLKKLSARLSTFQVQFFSALATNPKASYLLGIYQQRGIEKLVSLSASQSLSEFVQQSKIQLNQVPIACLSAESLSILDINVKKIKQMGIKLLGELFDLPGSAIGRRFGKSLLHYLYCLKGEVKDPQNLFFLPEKFLIKRCFVSGLDTIEQILFPARPMLENLSIFLKIRRAMVTKITWHFICFNSDELFFEIELSSEVQNTEQLIMLTRLKLQSFVLQEKVEMIFLEANDFIKSKEKQSSLALLGPRSGVCSHSESINSLMDKLKVRLGSERCSSLLLKDEYLPEKLSVTVQELRKSNPNMEALDLIGRQPLWLLEQPQTIGCFQNKGTLQLNYRGILWVITKAERVENGWWDNNQRRDYYCAENKAGVCYWIYHDLNDNRWFVHGVF